MTKKVLVTGQFWDSEFADLINGLQVPTTFIPSEKIAKLENLPQDFDLVIVAQSRRGSVQQNEIDRLKKLTDGQTIVNLLGSWCEGQERSGHPLNDVVPIYWHQWNGQFDQLLVHARNVETPATGLVSLDFLESQPPCFGVSALCDTQWEFVSEALQSLGIDSIWLEQAIWDGETIDAKLSAICLDCDTMNEQLERRLETLGNDVKNLPLILLANAPRKEEVADLQKAFARVSVVSKPFDLSEFAFGITGATGIELVHEPALPDRFTKRSNPSVNSSATTKAGTSVPK
ncbi:MAG: hypothetical protein R3C03_09860 [Pirellulaceae bacterium]